jgi:hypothetical protein
VSLAARAAVATLRRKGVSWTSLADPAAVRRLTRGEDMPEGETESVVHEIVGMAHIELEAAKKKPSKATKKKSAPPPDDDDDEDEDPDEGDDSPEEDEDDEEDDEADEGDDLEAKRPLSLEQRAGAMMAQARRAVAAAGPTTEQAFRTRHADMAHRAARSLGIKLGREAFLPSTPPDPTADAKARKAIRRASRPFALTRGPRRG